MGILNVLVKIPSCGVSQVGVLITGWCSYHRLVFFLNIALSQKHDALPTRHTQSIWKRPGGKVGNIAGAYISIGISHRHISFS